MSERHDKVVLGWVPQPMGGMLLLNQGLFDSVLGFLTHDAAHRQVFAGRVFAQAGYIPASRNMVVELFLTKTEAEWLMFLDWDVSFTPHVIYHLLDAADPVTRPIISGVYVTYFGDGNALRPCWMTSTEAGEYMPADGFTVGEVVELSVSAMGASLIHRGVLEAMKEAHAGDSWPWFGHDSIGGNRSGEDLTFCHRARQLGFSIWGHGGVLLGHTKAKELTPYDMLERTYSTSAPTSGPGTKRFLNIGGGSKVIPVPTEFAGWEQVLLDIDGGDGARGVDLVMDARELLERGEPDSFDGAYCSHNLEHYHAHEVPQVLAGALRVLKPGGELIVRTPDIGSVVRALSEGADLDEVAYQSPAGPILYRDMIYGFGRQIEESGQDFYAHRTGFTMARLRRVLEDAGFDNVAVLAHPERYELEAHATKAA